MTQFKTGSAKAKTVTALADGPTSTLVIDADETTASLLRTWLATKAHIKVAEKAIDDLKPRIAMLLPAGTLAKQYLATRTTAKGKFEQGFAVIKTVEQDRRSPDFDKLTALAQAKNAPQEAFELRVKDEYVAKMVEAGTITPAELKACLKGKVISYVQVDFVVDKPTDTEV